MSEIDQNDKKVTAGLELLRRTGAQSFQMRYSDDENPTVWIAVGEWAPRTEGGPPGLAVGAAFTPQDAMMKLLEEVIDGGHCTHCGKRSGFTPDTDSMPLDDLVCWYQWDPELATFRRGCEGSVG